jgi:hypothetical protein
MPSSSIDSCAFDSDTVPLVAWGQTKSLSRILCLRHTMANERSQDATTQEQEDGCSRHHADVDRA